MSCFIIIFDKVGWSNNLKKDKHVKINHNSQLFNSFRDFKMVGWIKPIWSGVKKRIIKKIEYLYPFNLVTHVFNLNTHALPVIKNINIVL